MTTILYVEDNDDNVYMLSRRLRRKGYEVLIARDGHEGLELAREAIPDLIIMDLVLPGLDGWEATRQLKSDPRTARVPVLALSASAMPGDSDRAMQCGADDFDQKPVEFERLLGKIARLLIR